MAYDDAAKQDHSSFWRQQLEGAPALLELPADRVRPARQSGCSGQFPLALSAELASSLRALSAAHGIPLQATLLAAWSTLLSRLSGQPQVVVGVAHPDAALQILPLLVDASAPQPVTGLLAHCGRALRQAADHADLAFDDIAGARGASFHPLCQAMLACDLAAPGAHDALFDIGLVLSTVDGIAGHLSFATDLFDAATAESFARYLVQLLAAMAADPAQPVSALAILPPRERRRILVEWNASACDTGPFANAHDHVAAQILRTPDAVAVRHDGRCLTYRELGQRANAVARRLLDQGVQPGDLVALFVRRSTDMVAGLLGILKAGAGYVPVDPSFPAERVAYMLSDAAARCVVSERALLPYLPPAMPALLTDELLPTDAEVHVAVDPGSVAYVIYTSGSTGKPKGVLLPHRAVVNLFAAIASWPGIGAADTIVAVTTVSFDISLVELLVPLTVGARIEIADAATAADGAALARLADACEATMMQATPASWRMLLDAGWQGRPGLRIISGGEPLPRDLADRLLARVAELWNLYGPSETTTYSTGERVLPDGGPVTIGRPVANTQAYIVDRNLQPVPVGVAGELLLGGLGVGIGYNARPELTAEKFIDDPFSGVAGSRLYRTGDLTRWTRDGRIEMLGRIDNQVKLRGFRIELGEIESVLGAQPGVRQAVVLCREDRPGDKRLVAYLAAPDGLALDSVRAGLGKALPSYMIPSAFVLLAQFPLTPTGKVDRRALPPPDRSAIVSGEFEAPADAQETAMAQVWQELLGLDRIGRNDNFFALGGHSLLAGQLIARLRRRFGADLSLRDLFDRPTVAELSSALAHAPGAEWMPIPPADRGAPLPTTPAQQRLWFLTQLDPAASLAYHMPAAYRLAGPLDRDALRDSLTRLLARHEALRTTFTAEGGVPRQTVSAPRCTLAEHDLSGQPEAALAEFCASEIARPFDLAAGPLFRAVLVRLGPDLHQLLILQHHIVSDGWSLGVMLAELSALYRAFSPGEPDPLPPLALQYADYAAWQRAPAQQAARARQTAYWHEHLEGAPALLELPTDRPRPARQSYRGASLAVALPAGLSAGLRALSQAHGATLFMTLLAGWSILLARHSGQDDIVVGTPVANRPRPELEDLIGFFVNTLALRVNLAADPDVGCFIDQVKGATLAAYAHQEAPLDEVVDAVKPVRSLAYSPLFQTVLALNNTPAKDGAQFGDVRLAPAPLPHRTTHFDLSLLLDDDGATVSGHIEYATDLFERATIERLAAGLQVVLAAMVADPGMALSRLPVMPEPERRRVLEDFNRTAAPYPRDGLVHRLFESRADAAPDAAALTVDGAHLSYAQLDAQANRLAHALLARGVQPGDRVAILLERSAAMIAAMLAVLKAGGCYVPLETASPAARTAWILADAAPAVIITDTRLAAGLAAATAQCLLVDSADLASQPAQRPRVSGLGPTSLAYVIYTSGSTGAPKGVMIEHRNVLRLVVNSGYAPITPADCIAHCANPAFDASTWEVWGALLNGARVLVVAHDTLLSPKAFNAALIDGGVTALWLTAGLFNEYADQLTGAFSRLTWLLAGGDVLDPATVARVLASQARPRHLLNGYGPTETTTFATTHAIASAAGRSIPIGRPIANTTVYILDRHLQPVPLGVVGEIHIGGDGVARGYLNQPAMSAERFIADPFSGGRLYRSGDLGRWLADGSIEFMGRNDFQVKIRGYRIELGEIEARLAECPGVREALVLAGDNQAGEKSLAAYLIAAADIDVAAVRSRLKSALPAYMQPSAYVVLERFPLTANGKVDRRALPAPDLAAPRTQAPEALIAGEENLAQIWRDLLRLAHIGRRDSFFDLGGNSLMATRLVSRIEQRYGIDFPLRAVFEGPQLDQMTARIAVEGGGWKQDALADLLSQIENLSDEQASRQLDAVCPPLGDPMNDLNARLAGLSPEKRALLMQQLGKNAVTTVKKEIGRRPRPARIPLSFQQQRLWIMDQLDSASAVYNVPTGMWMHGHPDVAILERTLGEIMRRHEVLRTVMGRDEEGPFQRVLPAAPFAIARHDLAHLPGAQRRAAALAIARAEAERPFDIAREPLLRAVLVSIDADEHLFLLNAHHIAVDGWSYSVIFRELCALYDAFHAGRPSPLEEPPIQYIDYTLWQNEVLAEDGATLKQQLGYWQERLRDIPPVLELPGDHVRPPLQSYRGALVPHRVDPSLYDAMKRLARDQGATVFMVLAAALQALLARYSGQHDLILGVGVANRRREELESLVGFFVNTLALRTDLSGNPSFLELLARVKEGTLGAYSHQDLPIERLLEVLDLDRSLSHSPLFQVMLFFQNFPVQNVELQGMTLSAAGAHEISSGSARTDLTLFAGEDSDGLAIHLEYATDLFEAATIEAFARHLTELLRSVVADPSRKLAAIDILPAAERRALLWDWNDSARDTGPARSVHALFEAQAARTPDAVAITHMGQQVSYRELERRANALAHALRARGVAEGDLVGLFARRSPDMMVALLGILKAGAAYVPLDPAYPAERIAFMLADSGARLVVSQRALAALLPPEGPPALLLDELPFNDAPLALEVNAESSAYVIYTSGSTGRPKGVLLPHRAVVNFLASMALEPGMTAADTVCAVTTLSFDIAVLELVLPLTLGARVEIADAATAADGAALARLIDACGATVMQATPASWRMLLDAGWTGRPGLKVLSGGEPLGRELADRLLACAAELWNMYGPTETTIWSTVERVTPGTGPIAIGAPIANTRLYVVDANLQPVPVGVPGELLIGGLGVALGYHARPELTAEKFIADPYSPDPAARLYRTGDLARWNRAGRVEVLGRIDNQVKLRGFRIELGEIESVLMEHAGVRQAVVVCREDRPGDKRLAAYLVADADGAAGAAELRAFCSARLPEYMLPSAYVTLAQLPMTPNGKIDRRALPAPDAGAAPSSGYAAPRNEQEQTLCGLWAQTLGLERVGIDDDFFKLGGHSLLATQLVMRIQKAFGGEVTLRSLFEAPTVAGFAELMLRTRLDSVDQSALAGMLDQLEGLSDDDIEALLAGAEQLP